MASFTDILAKYAAYDNTDGTDKTTTHSYGSLYNILFEQYRETARNVLEIGVYSGASVLSMSEYLINAHIDGVDINLSNLKFGRNNNKISYFEMDGTKPDLKVLNKTYDIILDDGSHFPQHQVLSLIAFTPYLNKSGMYIIDDISSEHVTNLDNIFTKHSEENNLRYTLYDLRQIKNRYDDIVAVFYKD